MDPITPGIQSPKSFNGTGVVAWITFKIIYVPTQPVDPPGPAYVQVGCNLDFDDTWTFIYKKPASVIPKDPSVGGTYTYKMLARQAGVPTADFTYSPGIPFVCDDVALTSTSTTPTGSTIVSYKWTVTGNATLTGSSTTAQTTMHCDGPGIATVTLNVTNSDGLWDEETKYIVQKEVIGCMLDLYTSDNRFCGQTTDYVGKGLNEACDALSPDVNVTLFVEITWNNAPVMHVLVAFEVIWEYYVQWDDPVMQLPENWVAKNECVLYRTAETDKDGIARIWFRVPTPCPGQMFGKWRAYATAKIQEVKQEDEMPFDVGYLITLVSLETEAPEYIREVDAISFRIKGKSISWMDKAVTFVVVAYDDCDVPIGQYIYETTISRGMYCSPNHFEIIIGAGIPVPQWAYVGIGKLYVSAFTAIPKDCGVAYCPEKGTLFEILYVPPP